jgi:hypothetical protein
VKFNLLPEPARLTPRPGRFNPAPALRIFLPPGDDAPVLLRAEKLCEMLRRERGLAASVDRRAPGARIPPGHVTLRLDSGAAPEGYRLLVHTRGIELFGRSAGLCHGVETLIQLFRDRGPRVPAIEIRDRPAFAHRGYYLDVSRGKVPTLDTLRRVVDRLAALKYNQFQLYVEHVFDFQFDPQIGAGSDPLRPGEILELDRYCRERHIQLVPSFACFGHMGKILSLPRYRRLAEIPWPAADWARATWRQRLHGATIDPVHPGSRALFEAIFAEFLPLFSAPSVNICGDETYDLGRGRNRARAGRAGIGRLYLDHVRFLSRCAAKYGKSIMLWGDVLLHHPEIIRRLPRDATVLDWGYQPTTPFEKVGVFLEAGRAAYVCPSVRGYGVVFNEVEEARANIAGYARTGHRLGADGLLVTDWGDMGHFNLLACSLHGMAVGSAMGWNPASEEGAALDRAFALQVFGDRSGRMARLYREAGSTGVASWPFLVGDFSEEKLADTASEARARQARKKAAAWMRFLETQAPAGWATAHDFDELAAASEALLLTAEKTLLVRRRRRAGEAPRRDWHGFSMRLRRFIHRYTRVWRSANKESNLEDVRHVLRGVTARARRRAG